MSPYNSTNPAPNPDPTANSGPHLLEDVLWIDANWMFVSTVLCPISLAMICLAFHGSLTARLHNPLLVGWLTATFYFAHQTEEHGYDMRGWRYAFVPGFNHGVGAVLFAKCEELGHISCPLDPRLTTYINTSFVWAGFVCTMVVATYKGGAYAYAGLCNWGTCVVNAGGGHLVPWILSGYNSGAFQSIFMFAFGVFAISRDGPKFAFACILNGILAHVVSFGITINLILLGIVPRWIEFVSGMFSTTVLPLVMARCAAPSESKWYIQIDEEDSSEEEGSDEDAKGAIE